MVKKRTTLDTLFAIVPGRHEPATPVASSMPMESSKKRPGIKQQTVYLPLAVHEQLRRLAFEEDVRMHDLLMEGLDKVFRDRGLFSVRELTEK